MSKNLNKQRHVSTQNTQLFGLGRTDLRLREMCASVTKKNHTVCNMELCILAVCMHVCMYACMYACTDVCMHMYVIAYTFECLYVSMYVPAIHPQGSQTIG